MTREPRRLRCGYVEVTLRGRLRPPWWLHRIRPWGLMLWRQKFIGKEDPSRSDVHTKEESIGHVLLECSKLAQTHYKSSHHRVADVVHWSPCHDYGLLCTSRWYEHYGREHTVIDTTEVKVLLDFNVETDHVIVHKATRHCSPQVGREECSTHWHS